VEGETEELIQLLEEEEEEEEEAVMYHLHPELMKRKWAWLA
jgi:hypothetical protein